MTASNFTTNGQVLDRMVNHLPVYLYQILLGYDPTTGRPGLPVPTHQPNLVGSSR